MSLRVLQRHYVSLFVAFLSRLSLRVFNCSAWRCHSHASLLVVCCWVGLLAIKLSFVAKSAITFVISPGAACHIGWVLLNNPVGLNGISIGHTATKYRRFRFALSKACQCQHIKVCLTVPFAVIKPAQQPRSQVVDETKQLATWHYFWRLFPV